MTAKLLIAKRSSVTAFGLKAELHTDGRERGLWIFFKDQSEARLEADNRRLDAACEIAFKIAGVKKKGAAKRFSLALNVHHEIGRLLTSGIDNGVLLEWPHIEEFYKVMGKAIKDHKTKSKPSQKRKRR